LSGKPDLFSKLPPAEPHWPEIRAWLQANPQTLLDDRSLLEEIGLKPHGRNVVDLGRAALTKLEEAAEREADARRHRARLEATLRAIRAGELAGGPSVAWTPWRPAEIEPLPPRPADAPPPDLTGDAARADALMAAAMARSTARVKAITPGDER